MGKHETMAGNDFIKSCQKKRQSKYVEIVDIIIEFVFKPKSGYEEKCIMRFMSCEAAICNCKCGKLLNQTLSEHNKPITTYSLEQAYKVAYHYNKKWSICMENCREK